jgi:hypothetical protein
MLAEVQAPPMGVAFDPSGVLWVTGGTLREGPVKEGGNVEAALRGEMR